MEVDKRVINALKRGYKRHITFIKQKNINPVDVLPIHGQTCYFCYLYHCEDCPYAKHHFACSQGDWLDVVNTLYSEYREVAVNLDRCKAEIIKLTEEYMNKLDEFKTVEELMEEKSKLLIKMCEVLGLKKTKKVIQEKYYRGEKYEG